MALRTDKAQPRSSSSRSIMGEGGCPGRASKPAESTVAARPFRLATARHKASAAGLRQTFAAHTIKVFKHLPLARRYIGDGYSSKVKVQGKRLWQDCHFT